MGIKDQVKLKQKQRQNKAHFYGILVYARHCPMRFNVSLYLLLATTSHHKETITSIPFDKDSEEPHGNYQLAEVHRL